MVAVAEDDGVDLLQAKEVAHVMRVGEVERVDVPEALDVLDVLAPVQDDRVCERKEGTGGTARAVPHRPVLQVRQ